MKKILLYIVVALGLSVTSLAQVSLRPVLSIDHLSIATDGGEIKGVQNWTQWKNDVWKLYVDTYGKFGAELLFQNPDEVLKANPEGIFLVKNEVVEGFIIFRETPYGLKFGLAAIKPSRSSYKSFQALMDMLAQKDGWYAEVSGLSYKFFEHAAHFNYVPVAQVRQILSKDIKVVSTGFKEEWPEEARTFVYQRNQIRNEHQIVIEKVMMGNPFLEPRLH